MSKSFKIPKNPKIGRNNQINYNDYIRKIKDKQNIDLKDVDIQKLLGTNLYLEKCGRILGDYAHELSIKKAKIEANRDRLKIKIVNLEESWQRVWCAAIIIVILAILSKI